MATSKKSKESTPPATLQQFRVVGVGASAGGLEAFKQFIAAIPENSGMAYVLVQHLSPSHESLLPDILQKITKISVYEITDDIHLAPNNIYTIPSNKILTATDGILSLSSREKLKTNLPINIFFTSLAEVHKELAAGVVLSGMGSDGTLGLKAIKEHGGITIAQDLQSAAYNEMPQNAMDAGVVDFVLAPAEISAQLLQIDKNTAIKDTKAIKESSPNEEESAYEEILALLNQSSGVDFTYYKQSTIQRRIARRIAMCKKKNLKDYLSFLRSHKDEQDALFQDMLIPVTSFFRDPKTFDILTSQIFPILFKNRTADEPIRIWVAGCSTGEEAYSIAICLHEYFEERILTLPIQIFASDISELAIKKARNGIYSKVDVQMVSDDYLKKYFRKIDGHYEVHKIIRDMCVFAPHNFLKDPPFGKMDLISCRNVLIYFDNFLQKKALITFHYSLKQNGFLLLGKTETTSAASELFALKEKQDKIYSPKPIPGRFIHLATEKKEEKIATQVITKRKPEVMQTDFRKSGEAMLLSNYTPASVIVNEQMDIVHIHGSVTPFLEPPPGKPTFNLLKMARGGLSFELRSAVHKAKTSTEPVIKEGIPSKPNGKPYLVNIEVVKLTDTIEPHYLILFRKVEITSAPSEELDIKSVKAKQYKESQLQNSHLELEIGQLREDMRSISEDQESVNEELQGANEELQSSNEEMQSLNEELETSKEELQSSNEELSIVYQELLDKQGQLNHALIYSENIISTIRNPIIVLDKDLRIITANASFYKRFNASEGEIEGKLFYEIQDQQWDDHKMRVLLEKILPHKEWLVDYEISLTFPELGERIMQLNARQIVNETAAQKLILLVIEDVTILRRKEQQKDDLRSIASHELITPLSTAKKYVEKLLQSLDGANKTDLLYVNKIKQSIEKLNGLINELLDVSKIQNDTLD
ncbi:MAG TPA: CheR family methyltransferase [Edaphocola sp.]|nr:CheR family methyltransferase [Edaphocola sp.]